MPTRFDLDAEIRSANPQEVLVALRDLLPDAAIETTSVGLRIRVQLDGESARAFNREILSALRRVERRTTLRAEWTSGSTVERFFDYVSKGTRARAAERRSGRV